MALSYLYNKNRILWVDVTGVSKDVFIEEASRLCVPTLTYLKITSFFILISMFQTAFS